MSGIKDLAVFIHWMDNSKQPTLEASLLKKRKLPRERQLILNDLKESDQYFSSDLLSKPHQQRHSGTEEGSSRNKLKIIT